MYQTNHLNCNYTATPTGSNISGFFLLLPLQNAPHLSKSWSNMGANPFMKLSHLQFWGGWWVGEGDSANNQSLSVHPMCCCGIDGLLLEWLVLCTLGPSCSSHSSGSSPQWCFLNCNLFILHAHIFYQVNLANDTVHVLSSADLEIDGTTVIVFFGLCTMGVSGVHPGLSEAVDIFLTSMPYSTSACTYLLLLPYCLGIGKFRCLLDKVFQWSPRADTQPEAILNTGSFCSGGLGDRNMWGHF